MAKELGLSLLDIAPLHERVRIGEGQELGVHGLSVDVIVRLFQRFPDVRGWMSGTGVKMQNLLTVGPEVVAAVIAYATTRRDQQDRLEEAEVEAAELPVEIQLEILEAVGRLTFRNGFAPFASKVVALMNGVAAGNQSGNPTAMTSPRASKPSSPPATTMPVSGT